MKLDGGNYQKYRELTKKIVRKTPSPFFYYACKKELAASVHFFQTDPLVRKIQYSASFFLKNNLGHTMAHSKKVALEAGALILREMKGDEKKGHEIERMVRLAHCSGLLHDIARKEKDHAAKGALKAEKLLEAEKFPVEDIQIICEAIRRHEAFREYPEPVTYDEKLLSDCLYDSDKFRWGPDNFAYTVWDMLEAASVPVKIFLQHYREGLRGIEKIRTSFRSESGKLFGPEFIDIGMMIAERLYGEMLRLVEES